jgi:hypothetical protein
LEKAPKQYSVELGYKYIYSSGFENKASQGYGILLDYSWMLSGFVNKHKVFLSVPLGYSYMMPDSETDEPISILNYGWTVRHELLKNKKNVPFLGYALLLNQLRIENIDGSVFGHQTKFELGYNFRNDKKVIYFAKIEYSFTRFPSLGNKKSNKIHAVEVKVGFRF